MKSEEEYGGSLFERIGNAAKSLSCKNTKTELMHSIQHSLQNILNTRSGSCYGSPELGFPDLNDDSLASMNLRDMTAQIVRDCILRYEPRISGTAITARMQDENAPLELRFHILANVDFNNHGDVLEFDILLDNHQHWRVE